MNPIENTYFSKTIPVSNKQCAPTNNGELSDAEFVASASNTLKEGYSKQLDKDYVSTQIYDLITQNPQLAKKYNLPTDQPAIKTTIVDLYYTLENENKIKVTGTVLLGPMSVDTDGNARFHITPQVGVCATVRKGAEAEGVDQDAIEVTRTFGEIFNYGPKFKQKDNFKPSFDKEVGICIAAKTPFDLSVPLKKISPEVKEAESHFNFQEGFGERIAKYRKPESESIHIKTVKEMKAEQNFSFSEGFSERIAKYRK